MKSIISRIVPNFLYFSGLSTCFRQFGSGLGAILQLQRVAESDQRAFVPNRFRSISPDFLNRLLTVLKADGYSFVSLDQMVEELQNPGLGKTRTRLIAVTVDLPYRDTFENAIPVLKQHETPFTVFVSPGLLEGQASLWWEVIERIIAKRNVIFVDLPKGRLEFDVSTLLKKKKAFRELHEFLICNVTNNERDRILNDLSAGYEESPMSYTSSQLVTWETLCEHELDPLCSLGATGLNFRVLSKLDNEECRFEISRSRDVIKLETGIEPKHFSVPYGDICSVDAEQMKLIEMSGYVSSLNSCPGIIYPNHSQKLFALPRLPVSGDRQSLRYMKTDLSGLPFSLRSR